MRYRCVVCGHTFSLGDDTYKRAISYVCIPCYDKYKDPVEEDMPRDFNLPTKEHDDECK